MLWESFTGHAISAFFRFFFICFFFFRLRRFTNYGRAIVQSGGQFFLLVCSLLCFCSLVSLYRIWIYPELSFGVERGWIISGRRRVGKMDVFI